ncbi:MAG: deoxyribose-phosphate aldolase [Bacillota bacterium]
MEPTPLTARAIAKMIDHSLLQPDMTDADIVEGCNIARRFDVASVCVRPYDVKVCKELLSGTDVLVSAVVGFPHGNSATETKVFETLQVIDDGAAEIDVVLPIGKVRSGAWSYVEREVGSVLEKAHQRKVIVKVIFENHYLTAEQIVQCCRLCDRLSVDFVKTSTGYAGTGATVEHIQLMRANCGPKVQIKAAGGIRTLDQFLALHRAGATRQGTRSTQAIVEAAEVREREGFL